MSIKKVIRMGNPALRQKATGLSVDEILADTTGQLIQDMVDTMKEEGGIGIAAPQIGVSKQVAIIELDSDNPRYKISSPTGRYIIFNPTIEVLDDQMQGFWEGCLSVPGLRGFVERPRHIRVNYLDEQARAQSIEVEDFLATVFQHELDHLLGILYVDKITDKSKLSYIEEYVQFWQD